MQKTNKEETVKFRVFKGQEEKYQQDLFVGINGKTYLIKRGVDMELPKSVVEVLENSQEQMQVAYDMMTESAYKDLEK